MKLLGYLDLDLDSFSSFCQNIFEHLFSPMNPTAELCEFEVEKHLARYFVEFIPVLSIVW